MVDKVSTDNDVQRDNIKRLLEGEVNEIPYKGLRVVRNGSHATVLRSGRQAGGEICLASASVESLKAHLDTKQRHYGVR